MTRFYLPFTLIIIHTTMLHAQTLTLQEVTFAGNGHVDIRDDSGLVIFSAPQWTPTAASPAAFISGYPVSAEAKFTSSGTLPPSVLIKGITTGNYEFPAFSSSTANPANIVYPLQAATAPFPYHHVNYYDPFTIAWSVSFDNGLTWQGAGTSGNKLYVLYQIPIPESGFSHQHSLFEISCRNAQGDSTESDIINHVWSEFTDRIVTDVQGDTLGYYSGNVWSQWMPYTFELIKDNFGICDHWGSFFLDLLKIQGLNYAGSYDVVTPEIINPTVCGDPPNASCFYLVNNHHAGLASGNPFTCPPFPYLNVFDGVNFTYLYSEISDSAGMPGQNNLNPPPMFGGHVLILINGVYYDPSYGNSYPSLNDYKLNALTGFAILISGGITEFQLGIDLNQDSLLDSITLYGAWKISTDLSLGKLDESQTTYGQLPSGISENNSTANNSILLELFPNPARSMLTLRRKAGSVQTCEINIYDITGRIIFSSQVASGILQTEIDIRDFAPGIYLVKAGAESGRFVKE